MFSEVVNSATKGVFWSYIEQFGRLAIRFIVSIFLARILFPEDFGLIGMMAIFINVSQVFIDSGFGTALIQRKKTSNVDESTIFYFNFFTSIIIYFILFFTAPLISNFYNQPELINILRVFSLSLVIGSLGSIHNLLFTKALNFKKQSVISITSSVISGIVGVVLALKGFEVWSLVYMTIIERLLTTILLWMFSKWRPKSKFSFQSLKGLFSYSSKILLIKSIDKIYANIYTIIIGKFYSAASLGFYTRAKSYYGLASQSIISSFIRVAFPSFCKLQDNKEDLKRALSGSIRTVSFILIPIVGFLFICARPLIVVLIGEKWLQSVEYLQIISLAGIVLPLNAFNRQMLNAIGRSDLFLRIGIIEKVLITIVLIASFKFGIFYMILANIVCVSIPVTIINTYYSNKILNYGFFKQIKDVLHIWGLVVFVASISYVLKFWISNNLILLFAQMLTGGSLYLFGAYIFKFKELSLVVNLLTKRKNNKNG